MYKLKKIVNDVDQPVAEYATLVEALAACVQSGSGVWTVLPTSAVDSIVKKANPGVFTVVSFNTPAAGEEKIVYTLLFAEPLPTPTHSRR